VRRERPWSQTLEPLLRFCAQPRKRTARTANLGAISARAEASSRRHDTAGPRPSVAGQASTPEFSVIVPTHNRRPLLAEVLSALEAQEGAPSFEVVVVDDGSRDETAQWLAQHGGARVRVLRQPHLGAAAARNAGIRVARGRIVAFLGDDTVPEPGWLAGHHACHCASGHDPLLAVIGRVAWHRRVKVTPFLHYINEQGKQFGYALIDDPRDLPFYFFYTSNSSLHRDTAGSELFDERFPYAAWEDTEFAYRLKRRGLRIDYEPAARVAHDHPTSIGRFMRRQERVGYSAVIFHARHPELGPFLGLGPDGPPPNTRATRERLIELRVRALDRVGISSPAHWDEILRLSYLGGLHRGWRELRQLKGGAV
jgi:glycosyltransferase involved in cell wall biosynthesis